MNLLRNIIKGSNRLFGDVSFCLFIGSLFWKTEFDILTVTDYSNIYMIYSKAY